MNAWLARLVSVLMVFSASFALAQQAPPPSDPKKAPGTEKKAAPAPGEPGAPAASAAGLVVFIDPVTGKIRQPDAAEIGRLVSPPTAVTSPVDEPLVMKIGPGGAVGVVLDSRFESFMVVTKTSAGTLAMDCVTGGRKADEIVSVGARTARKPDGKEAPLVR